MRSSTAALCAPRGCCRTLVSLAVHLCSRALWPGYSKMLRPTERRQWCNKIACGLHVSGLCAGCRAAFAGLRLESRQLGWRSCAARRQAAGRSPFSPTVWLAHESLNSACVLLRHPKLLQAAVLAYHQAWNLFDPVLNADPLHGVTGAAGCAGWLGPGGGPSLPHPSCLALWRLSLWKPQPAQARRRCTPPSSAWCRASPGAACRWPLLLGLGAAGLPGLRHRLLPGLLQPAQRRRHAGASCRRHRRLRHRCAAARPAPELPLGRAAPSERAFAAVCRCLRPPGPPTPARPRAPALLASVNAPIAC